VFAAAIILTLATLLDGDLEALAAYRDRGARGSSEPVARYYRRCDLADLLERPGFAAWSFRKFLATIEYQNASFALGPDGVARIRRVRPGWTIELDQDANPTIDIFFSNAEAFSFKPIIPTLLQEPRGTIRDFRREAKVMKR
jgi:hypothetical protein